MGIQGVVIIIFIHQHAWSIMMEGAIIIMMFHAFICFVDEGEVQCGVDVGVGGSPLFGKAIPFEHPHDLRHFRTVSWQVLGAEKCHLEHLPNLDAIVVATELLVN